MIKKFLLWSILLLIFCVSFASALAQDTRIGTTSKPRVKLQVQGGGVAEKREEAKSRIEEFKKRNIRNYFSSMGKRIGAALIRLDKLAGRIESRITKLKERGQDTSGAQAALEEARGAIEAAKTAFNEAKAKLDTALSSDNPKVAFRAVREGLVKGVIDKIKEAHKALVEAMKALKNTENL